MLRRSAKRLADLRNQSPLLDHLPQLSLINNEDTSHSAPQSHNFPIHTTSRSYHYWRCPENSSNKLFSTAVTAPPFKSTQLVHPLQNNINLRTFASAPLESSTPAAAQQLPTWIQKLPPSWWPYLQLSRLDKPIGTWLLLWPCLWSIALASPPGSLPDLRITALFTAGAVLLRGAGCTVNDLWDRDLDSKVERTKNRPLASGAVTPVQAIGWLAAQLSAGLGILLQLNPYAQLVGASSLALVVTYPLTKRITGWPQAFLGLTFNWGALFGWAAVNGNIDWGVALPLYLSGVCWTLVYDTIYAHQDKVDDVAVGIKSTALTFGEASKKYFAGFAAANTGLLALAGYMAGCGDAYYAGVAAGAAHLAWQIGTVDLNSREDCQAKFVSNKWYGALIFSGIMADRVIGPLLL